MERLDKLIKKANHVLQRPLQKWRCWKRGGSCGPCRRKTPTTCRTFNFTGEAPSATDWFAWGVWRSDMGGPSFLPRFDFYNQQRSQYSQSTRRIYLCLCNITYDLFYWVILFYSFFNHFVLLLVVSIGNLALSCCYPLSVDFDIERQIKTILIILMHFRVFKFPDTIRWLCSCDKWYIFYFNHSRNRSQRECHCW